MHNQFKIWYIKCKFDFYDQTDDGVCDGVSSMRSNYLYLQLTGIRVISISNKNAGKGNVYVYLDVIKSYLIKLCRFIFTILFLYLILEYLYIIKSIFKISVTYLECLSLYLHVLVFFICLYISLLL